VVFLASSSEVELCVICVTVLHLSTSDDSGSSCVYATQRRFGGFIVCVFPLHLSSEEEESNSTSNNNATNSEDSESHYVYATSSEDSAASSSELLELLLLDVELDSSSSLLRCKGKHTHTMRPPNLHC